jgi:deoxycytidine triphosphate deaminase
MITGEQLSQMKIIEGAEDGNYRGASYDIRVGTIIQPDATESPRYSIPPQGIVEIVSKETVKMPPDISGLAIVKTSLCNEGLLPLNIGIIDPSYEGHISSFIVNFSKKDQVICKDEVFMRLVFLKSDGSTVRSKRFVESINCLEEKKKNMLNTFDKEFLNISRITEAVTKKTVDEYFWNGVKLVGVAAIIITFAAFLSNIGNFVISNYFVRPADDVKVEQLRSVIERQATNNDVQQKLLLQRIDILTNEISSKDKTINDTSQRLGGLERALIELRSRVEATPTNPQETK